MKTTGRSTDWREDRRLRAWELHEKGWRQSMGAIVDAGGVSESLRQ